DRAIFEIVEPNITRQVEFLTPLDELFNQSGYDIARMTFYQSSGGDRGELWQAFEALGDLNRATMNNLGVLTQQSAYRGAQISQREGGLAAGGLLLPWLPEVPWEEGAFDDFESAVAEGQLPDGQNDAEFNRGPFDVLFGQRRWGRLSNQIFSNLPEDVRHSPNALGWIAPPSTRQFERADVETYLTTGTYEQLLSQVSSLASASNQDRDNRPRSRSAVFFQAPAPPTVLNEQAPLAPSQWADRVSFAANIKINSVFPGTASANQIVHDPEWITDYRAAEAIVDSGGQNISYALYLAMEFRRFKADDDFTFTEPELISWGLRRDDGNVLSPPIQGNTALLKIADHVWREELPQSDNPDFEEGDVQYLNYIVWLGVNVGEEVNIRNPYNFDGEDRSEMPGPVNFTVGEFEPQDTQTREALRLLGVAHQPKEARFWPEKFDEGRADEDFVALAQAQLFNNHSWDLWTAMWHAQLTPINGLDEWMEALEDPQGLDEMPWLEEEDLDAVAAYLRAAKPLMDLMLEDE
ncbi:MAG: hypothetical protein AAF593_07690, partial [Planctomycetota bacterium]